MGFKKIKGRIQKETAERKIGGVFSQLNGKSDEHDDLGQERKQREGRNEKKTAVQGAKGGTAHVGGRGGGAMGGLNSSTGGWRKGTKKKK